MIKVEENDLWDDRKVVEESQGVLDPHTHLISLKLIVMVLHQQPVDSTECHHFENKKQNLKDSENQFFHGEILFIKVFVFGGPVVVISGES